MTEACCPYCGGHEFDTTLAPPVPFCVACEMTPAEAYFASRKTLDALTEPRFVQRRKRLFASADTHPKGQDAKQGLAGTVSGVVPKGDAQND